jgi:hypothetical protein
MAIFRCSKCTHLREVSNEHIGKVVKCPQCQQPVKIYNTVIFIEKFLEKYFIQAQALREIQQQVHTPKQEEEQKHSEEEVEKNFLEEIDIYHTDALKKADQYQPILQWFEQRKIAVEVNHKALDTTGFFDEVALALGENIDLLKEIVDKIKYVQFKGYSDVKINLGKRNQEQIKKICSFCQDLYDYSFVSRYIYIRDTKIIRMKVQNIPAITHFFNGEWLEWLVFMKLLEFFQAKKIPVSCLRNVSITFQNKDVHEIDIFFLINGSIPIYIECKSGEFQQYIDKHLSMRKKIGIDKTNFLLCIIGLSQKQCEGLSGMYELTFVNEQNFLEHIEKII